MMKTLEYIVPKSIDETWKLTEEYFKDKKMAITRKEGSATNSSWKMGFKDVSAFSWPDTIDFELFRTDCPVVTRAVVRANLIFQTGAAWARPQKLLRGWALTVGTEPQGFARKTILISNIVCAIIVITLVIIWWLVFGFR